MGTNSKWQKQNPVRELAHGVCRETGTPTCRKTALLKAKACRKWRTYPSLKVCRKTSTELIYHMLQPPLSARPPASVPADQAPLPDRRSIPRRVRLRLRQDLL